MVNLFASPKSSPKERTLRNLSLPLGTLSLGEGRVRPKKIPLVFARGIIYLSS
jgi:hypothetical protein